MALAKHGVNKPSRLELPDGAVVSDPKKHEIYDHRLQPLYSLDAFLTGSAWSVTYFKQRLGIAEPTKKLDISSDPAYQSYDKIEKLELLAQGSISSSYRDKEALIEVTGTSLLPSFLKPNIDDYFVTESNLGRLALFRITNVNRRTHEKESVYLIDYQIEQEVKEDDVLLKDLNRKTVSTYVFSKQRLIENKNAILLKQTYQRLVDMHYAFRTISQKYFRDFFNMQTMTLQVPGQLGRHVDPYILDFFISIVPMEIVPELSRMRLISLNNDRIYEQPCLWNILISRSYFELETCNRYFSKLCPKHLPTSYFSRSGNFASADYVICPMNKDGSLETLSYQTSYCNKEVPKLEINYTPTKNNNNESYTSLEIIYSEIPNLPAYLEVQSKDSYIFTEDFYRGEPSSILEIMLLDYIRQQPINLDQLSFLVSLYPSMPRLEQFYYGPMILLLLKEADRGAYA